MPEILSAVTVAQGLEHNTHEVDDMCAVPPFPIEATLDLRWWVAMQSAVIKGNGAPMESGTGIGMQLAVIQVDVQVAFGSVQGKVGHLPLICPMKVRKVVVAIRHSKLVLPEPPMLRNSPHIWCCLAFFKQFGGSKVKHNWFWGPWTRPSSPKTMNMMVFGFSQS